MVSYHKKSRIGVSLPSVRCEQFTVNMWSLADVCEKKGLTTRESMVGVVSGKSHNTICSFSWCEPRETGSPFAMFTRGTERVENCSESG